MAPHAAEMFITLADIVMFQKEKRERKRPDKTTETLEMLPNEFSHHYTFSRCDVRGLSVDSGLEKLSGKLAADLQDLLLRACLYGALT